jgi:two-component system, cell cycle sensor histidine kinase and response regulator CckA
MAPSPLGIEGVARLARAVAAAAPDQAVSAALAVLAEAGIFELHEPAPAWLEVIESEATLRFGCEHQPGDEVRELLGALMSGVLKRAAEHQTLCETRERMTLLSSAAFEALLVHVDGYVIDANDRLAELLRCTPAEARGNWLMQACIAPEDLSTVLQRVSSGYEGAYVITGVRKDGTRFRAELQSKQGTLGKRPVRVVAVRDVTERDRVSRMVAESEAQLRHLTDHVFETTVLSRSGKIVEVRGRVLELLGYTPEQMLEREVTDFVAASSLSVVRTAMTMHRVGSYRATGVARDGSLVPLEVVAVNATVAGVPTRVAGLRDLRETARLESERLQLEQQVARSQRLASLEVLAGGVAHDFNNLLVGILGNADFLLTEVADPSQREALEEITEAATRAGQLTARLLTYAGRGELGPTEPLEMGQLLREVEPLIRRGLSQGRIVLAADAECHVIGNRNSLRQLLVNLLTNAAEALAESHGEIQISVKRIADPGPEWGNALGALVGPGNWVLVEVRDTGVGMCESTLSHLFEPFYTTKRQGQGLGLAASLGILSAHGGAIRVASEPNVGSCFSLLLPAAEPTHRGAMFGRSDATACRVLLVDDESMVRAQMRRTLELRGFLVKEAEDGAAALATLEREQFDLMILDMRMPLLDGADVVEAVRHRGMPLPIVVASGYLDPLTERRLRPDSFQAFLRKPYSVDELLEAIAQAQEAQPIPQGVHDPLYLLRGSAP